MNQPIEIELSPGNHNIELNSSGCVFSDDVFIEFIDTSGLSLVVNSVGTNAYQLSLVGTNYNNIAWSSNANLSCADCSTTSVAISENTSVNVTANYGEDCVFMDRIDLNYTPVVKYYIPNIIDLNNPSNDRFYIGSNFDQASVLQMLIYDRFGNLVHSVEDSPVNDPDLGWNGFKNNEPVEQGVYVYLIKVLNTAGEEEIYTGNLTVIR